jgi:hypothetical protein
MEQWNDSIIFTAPAQLNPILFLFNRGETFFLFHWGHVGDIKPVSSKAS